MMKLRLGLCCVGDVLALSVSISIYRAELSVSEMSKKEKEKTALGGRTSRYQWPGNLPWSLRGVPVSCISVRVASRVDLLPSRGRIEMSGFP